VPDEYLAAIDEILTARLGDRGQRVSQDELDKLSDMGNKRLDAYKLADEYYSGDQDTRLTDRMKQYLELNGKVRYVENICQIVADSFVERLVITGVTTSEDEPAPPENPLNPLEPKPPKPMDLADWLWNRVWDGNNGDERMITVHNDVGRRGDAFVIVDYDTERLRPRIVRQLPDQIRVIYANGIKRLAVKKWYTDDQSPTNPEGRKVCRMNLYFPDRIEKWMRLHDNASKSEGGWIEWVDDGDTQWPTPWVGNDGKPLGIPVFHLANRPDDSGYGVAEHLIVIPIQNRLNKELLDLSAILDTMGAPQRYAIGVESTENLKSAPGEIWSTGSDTNTAQFGQFDPADPTGPLKSIESTITRASTISRTPRYMLELTGGAPSGEAMHTAESGLVSKVKGRQPFLGNQWTEALRMSVLVALTFGGTADEEQPPVDLAKARSCSINVVWTDPRTFNELEHLQTLGLMKALGIPDEYLWSRIEGIDVDAIKQMKMADDIANAAVMAAQFNRGGQTNPSEPGQGVPPPAAPQLAVPPEAFKIMLTQPPSAPKTKKVERNAAGQIVAVTEA